MKKTGKTKTYLMTAAVVVIGIVIDQLTKLTVLKYLKGQSSVPLIRNVFHLTYVENRGAAFGILQGKQIIFFFSVLIVVAAVIYILRKLPDTNRFIPLKLCLSFVLAGAFGNMIDRVRLGYVVDFFDFRLINFPVFNVADIYVTVSFTILLILIFFYYKDEDFNYLSLKKQVEPATNKDE